MVRKKTKNRQVSASETTRRSRSAWLRQHRLSARDALGRFRVQFTNNFLSVLVIGITLALPLSLFILQDSFATFGAHLNDDPEVTLFLEKSATLAMAETIADEVSRHQRIYRGSVIDKDAALATLVAESGDIAAVVANLEENPLPYAVVLKVSADAFDGDAGAALRERLSNMPGVADSAFDVNWRRRLDAIVGLVQHSSRVAAGLIGIGVILIVGNTIRVGIHGRREEIDVAKLCGATDSYVRRPFLYSGVLHGLLGALLACTVVWIAMASLDGAARNLAQAYGNDMELFEYKGLYALFTILSGLLMGWLGAVVAVSLYLRQAAGEQR